MVLRQSAFGLEVASVLAGTARLTRYRKPSHSGPPDRSGIKSSTLPPCFVSQRTTLSFGIPRMSINGELGYKTW